MRRREFSPNLAVPPASTRRMLVAGVYLEVAPSHAEVGFLTCYTVTRDGAGVGKVLSRYLKKANGSRKEYLVRLPNGTMSEPFYKLIDALEVLTK